MEKQWFEQAISQGCLVYDNENKPFVIYRGFKIIKTELDYIILDVRKNDMYTKVTDSDYTMFKELGFTKGADKISYLRNKNRVYKLEKTIKKLNYEKQVASSKLQENVKFYTKKLRNLDVNTIDAEDLLIFYKSKIKQHEDKNSN